MKIIEPLQKFKKSQTDIVLFLGGTCSSKNWRKDLILFLEDMNKTLQLSNLVIINPYRKDWPSTIDKLSQQIEWECQMLYQSDIFSAYFEKTGGNFTFFELGKAIYQMKNLGVTKANNRLILSCHEKYEHLDQLKFEIEYTSKLLKLDNISLESISNITKHGSKIIQSYFKLLK